MSESILNAASTLSSLEGEASIEFEEQYINEKVHRATDTQQFHGALLFDKDTSDSEDNLDCEKEPMTEVSFPTQLMHILNHGIAPKDIVMWLPQGNAFVIKDRKRFCLQLLPLYFGKYITYSAFNRLLTQWGFEKIGNDTYSGRYFHRDRPQMCSLMRFDGVKPKGFGVIKKNCEQRRINAHKDTKIPKISIFLGDCEQGNLAPVAPLVVCRRTARLPLEDETKSAANATTLSDHDPCIFLAQWLAEYYEKRRKFTSFIVQQAYEQLQLDQEAHRENVLVSIPPHVSLHKMAQKPGRECYDSKMFSLTPSANNMQKKSP